MNRDEHVLILIDRLTVEVGRAIAKAAKMVTAKDVKLFILEEYTDRPANELPETIAKEIPWANVTFLALESKPGELALGHYSSEQRSNMHDMHTCQASRGNSWRAECAPIT